MTLRALTSGDVASGRAVADRAVPPTLERPSRMVWSRRRRPGLDAGSSSTRSSSCDATSTIAAVASSTGSSSSDDRGDLAGGDPGEQRPRRCSSAPASSAAVAMSDAQQGCGREVAAQLLEHHRGLHERGPEAVVLLRHGQRGHADLLAEGLPQRLVVPALGVHRRADGGAVAVLVEQPPHDRGELLLLLGAGEVHQRASATQHAGPGGTPRAPGADQRADLG